MSVFNLVMKELLHRKANALLSLLGVMAAVGLLVFFVTSSEGAQKETSRLMRDLGLNLRIISEEADMQRFYATGVADVPMPEDSIDRLASKTGLRYVHLLAMLRQRTLWQGGEVVLEGRLPERSPADKKKPIMVPTVEPGTVHVGAAIAAKQQLSVGDDIELMGETFEVAKVLPTAGDEQDSTIALHLHDLQPLLGMDDQINEIQALNCVCFDRNDQALDVLRKQLSTVLPDAQVLTITSIFRARQDQREMLENFFAVLVPVVLVVAAGWVCLLAMLNVRERRSEIGILRALGYRSGRIGGLFLGKSAFIGLAGAIPGCLLGTVAALIYGPSVFEVTGKAIQPMASLILSSLIAAPVFAMIAAMIPTTIAVLHEPAVVLREE